MKRIGFITLGVVVIFVVAVIFLTVTGPRAGRVFSTINARLPAGNESDKVSYNVMVDGFAAGAPAPATESMDTQSLAYYNNIQRNSDASGNPVEQNRLVIKNADLTIVVKDPKAKMQTIATMAETMGGFVVSSSMGEAYVSDGTKVPEGSIVVRIPAAKLDEALKEIKGDIVELQNETQSGQDVTKEYTDLGSQLKNLEATEKKLTEIMDKAEKTEDVLAVFNQLTQIRGQIEVIKGQRQYYEQAAALSAVSVRLIAEKTIQPVEIAGWQPQGEARDAVQALVDFFQGFVDFLIWLVIFFIPVAAIVIVLAALLWRLGKWLWKKFSPKKSAAE